MQELGCSTGAPQGLPLTHAPKQSKQCFCLPGVTLPAEQAQAKKVAKAPRKIASAQERSFVRGAGCLCWCMKSSE